MPDAHPVFAAAAAARCRCSVEFDLAGRWDDRPLVAITGTDGKTTVTTMVTAMLRASGRRRRGRGQRRRAAGRGHRRPGRRGVRGRGVVVPPRAHAPTFRPQVATWLNFAPDHLDVHARSSATRPPRPASGPSSVRRRRPCANADDPVVMREPQPPGGTVTFSTDGRRRLPDGGRPAPRTARRADHRRSASCGARCPTTSPTPSPPPATAVAAGADVDGVRERSCDVPRAPPSGRARGRGWRGAVVRRLQGHRAPRHAGRRARASTRSCSSPAAATRAST